MRTRLATLVALLLPFLAFLSAAPPAHAATGLHVSGTKILEGGGSTFVMRGTSHAHTWYPTQTASFAGIKSLGANTVRVVLSGGRWTANGAADVANVVSLCKQNKLICVLENHDTTGYGEQSGAYTLDQAVDYWISVKSALAGQEDYVVINIGNEPFGNNATTPGWTQATSAAIGRMRDNGFQHLLMVDAPNWGQDWAFTMRDNARTVFAADPQRNTVFSVHMYGVFDTAAEVTGYLQHFQTAGLPLVIGEFGFNHSDGDPDEDTIMAQAQARGVGYLGWSWSGNGGGVEYLDQVTNFNVASLTTWGQRLFNGADGIAQTSVEAAVYGGGGTPDTEPPGKPGKPTATDITATGARLTWTASTDNRAVTSYDIYRGTTRLTTSTTNTTTLTGLTPETAYTLHIVARDAAGNTSPASETITFTTSATPPGGCTATYKTVNSWQGGFQGQVTITCTTAATSWKTTLTYPTGVTVTQAWSSTLTATPPAFTFTNAPWNGTVPAGGSTTFGFIATWNGTGTPPTPTIS
ncbi:mannan endo-1,4-beta-mannosidase [Streptosporangium becharense]|uniref:Endoglucanase n=1 Tax=Streptosporangium becharense TaxID=1816182 RepID=A0A7W9IFF0_9ACTN|nr:cellulase family glycosylhydrolase [Streptosporangium becharense]MBB2909257.1 mannan endo-1,4-beta-mannosidase [Streptosporangium becharense]MBB5819724.1 mannan endo-1,4-beta-mannosidase [Streptosporangium becharense]